MFLLLLLCFHSSTHYLCWKISRNYVGSLFQDLQVKVRVLQGPENFLVHNCDTTSSLQAWERHYHSRHGHTNTHTFSIAHPRSFTLFPPLFFCLSSCLSLAHSSPKSPAATVLSSLLERGTGLPVLER